MMMMNQEANTALGIASRKLAFAFQIALIPGAADKVDALQEGLFEYGQALQQAIRSDADARHQSAQEVRLTVLLLRLTLISNKLWTPALETECENALERLRELEVGG